MQICQNGDQHSRLVPQHVNRLMLANTISCLTWIKNQLKQVQVMTYVNAMTTRQKNKTNTVQLNCGLFDGLENVHG